jgi:threonine aldolase
VNFRSDNVSGASPEIVEAIARANRDFATSYGDDDVTARLRRRCCELFETEVDVVPVVTGTAANALSIASITPPWGVAFAHYQAHMLRDEWNAPEFFSGARVVPIRAAAPTFTADELRAAIEDVLASDVGVPHQLASRRRARPAPSIASTICRRFPPSVCAARSVSPCTWTAPVSPTPWRSSAARRRTSPGAPASI